MEIRKVLKKYYYILFLLLFLNACSQHKEPIYEKGDTPPQAILTGGVQKVVDGQVKPEDMVEVLTERFLFALGGGTFGSIEEMGEGMLLSGQGYVKTSNESEGYKLLSGDSFKTPFLVGIKSDTKLQEIISVDEPKNIQDVYRDLAQKYDFFAVIGIGDFEETITTALKKAPIYGENIVASENRSSYFHPLQKLKGVPGIFVGIVQTAASAKENPTFSKRIFYASFAGTANTAEIQSHTHIAFLNTDTILPKTKDGHIILSAIPVAEIKDVQHLLSQSKLHRALIMVYPIDHAEQYN